MLLIVFTFICHCHSIQRLKDPKPKIKYIYYPEWVNMQCYIWNEQDLYHQNTVLVSATAESCKQHVTVPSELLNQLIAADSKNKGRTKDVVGLHHAESFFWVPGNRRKSLKIVQIKSPKCWMRVTITVNYSAIFNNLRFLSRIFDLVKNCITKNRSSTQFGIVFQRNLFFSKSQITFKKWYRHGGKHELMFLCMGASKLVKHKS